MQGGKILTGGSVIESEGNFVQPTIVEISPSADVVKEELFGPVLYVLKFKVSFQQYLICSICEYDNQQLFVNAIQNYAFYVLLYRLLMKLLQ